MSNEEYKISIEGFEVGLQMYMESFIGKVVALGYSEDEIVAIDLEEDDVLFYMSDCKILRVKKTPIVTIGKIAEA